MTRSPIPLGLRSLFVLALAALLAHIAGLMVLGHIPPGLDRLSLLLEDLFLSLVLFIEGFGHILIEDGTMFDRGGPFLLPVLAPFLFRFVFLLLLFGVVLFHFVVSDTCCRFCHHGLLGYAQHHLIPAECRG